MVSTFSRMIFCICFRRGILESFIIRCVIGRILNVKMELNEGHLFIRGENGLCVRTASERAGSQRRIAKGCFIQILPLI